MALAVADVAPAPPPAKIAGLLEIPRALYDPEREIPAFLTLQPKEGGGTVMFRPNSIQARYLAAMAYDNVVLKPRQVGQTTIVLADSMMRALFTGTNMVIASQKETLGMVKLRQVEDWLKQLQKLHWPVNFIVNNSREIVLGPPLGAAFWVESADGDSPGRGRTINLLHGTEAAFWTNDAIAKFASLAGSMPPPPWGLRTYESTPNGAAGLFYDTYRKAKTGENTFRAHFFPWWLDPIYRRGDPPDTFEETLDEDERWLRKTQRLTLEQLWWRRNRIADLGDLFAQEYPEDDIRCFLTSGKAVFKAKIVQEMIAETRKARSLRQLHDEVDNPKALIWKDPLAGGQYVIGVDGAEGIGGDYNAAAVVDFRTMEHVATLRSNTVDPKTFAILVDRLGRYYNEAYLAVERNESGSTIIRTLYDDLDYPNLFFATDMDGGDPERDNCGFHTNMKTKPSLINDFRELLVKGYFRTPDEELVTEIANYVHDDSRRDHNPNAKIYQRATAGGHDDLLMATMIACFVREFAQFNNEGRSMPTASVTY